MIDWLLPAAMSIKTGKGSISLQHPGYRLLTNGQVLCSLNHLRKPPSGRCLEQIRGIMVPFLLSTPSAPATLSHPLFPEGPPSFSHWYLSCFLQLKNALSWLELYISSAWPQMLCLSLQPTGLHGNRALTYSSLQHPSSLTTA